VHGPETLKGLDGTIWVAMRWGSLDCVRLPNHLTELYLVLLVPKLKIRFMICIYL
jgi:hypothetical protein